MYPYEFVHKMGAFSLLCSSYLFTFKNPVGKGIAGLHQVSLQGLDSVALLSSPGVEEPGSADCSRSSVLQLAQVLEPQDSSEFLVFLSSCLISLSGRSLQSWVNKHLKLRVI